MYMNNIKTIIFDWGGVMCSEGEPFSSLALQKKVGKKPDEMVLDVLGIYNDFYRGVYNDKEFWNLVKKHYRLEEDDSISNSELNQAYLKSYFFWPEMLDFVKSLKGKYKVGLLSDMNKIMRDHIQKKHTLSEVFQEQMYSCDKNINLIKNDGPKIFELMMKKTGEDSPQSCLFIDNSQNKINVAKKFGMHTLLFKDVDSFLEDIKDYL